MADSRQLEHTSSSDDTQVYRTCSTKRRRTQADIRELKNAIRQLCEEHHPRTVRGLFYQLVKLDLIEKSEKDYKNQVSRLCGIMREEGELPWHWIADTTRWMRKPDSWDSVEQFQKETAQLYRRELWRSQRKYVEVWCEKATLAGLLTDVTYEWDVPLMCTTGFSSKGFIHSAAQAIVDRDCPSFIYYLGDHDPSGLKIWEALQKSFERYYFDIAAESDWSSDKMVELCPTFEKLAVLPWQIEVYELPTRPTKTGSAHAKSWNEGDSVELDAMPEDALQRIVTDAIVQHIDQSALEQIKKIEASEREMLTTWMSKGKRR
jgi:hypothetical protein